MRWKSKIFRMTLVVCLLGSSLGGVSAQETQPAEQEKVANQQTDAATANQQTDAATASQNQEDEAVEAKFDEMSLEEIAKDYTTKCWAYTKRYRAAPTAAEKLEVFKTKPNVKPYWPRLSELINDANGTDAGLEIIDWWYIRGGRREGSDVIVGLLLNNYSQKKSINKYVPKIAYHLPAEEAAAALRSLCEVNPFDAVKATATYELHELLRKQSEELDGDAAESLLTEVRTLRDSLYATYPDAADTMGAKYTGLLDAIDFASNLEIGKPVPDIEGVDLKGVLFKLSDYQGKVRVISFWGDW